MPRAANSELFRRLRVINPLDLRGRVTMPLYEDLCGLAGLFCYFIGT
jgi:hypothetical protein